MSAPAIDTSDMDPELARYLNRNYWQQRSEDNKSAGSNVANVPSVVSTTTPSAPTVAADPKFSTPKVQEVRLIHNWGLIIPVGRRLLVS